MSGEIGTARISGDFIELCSLLKLEGIAESGGEAKQLICEGHVRVNGAEETRKRKKIYSGDVVECQGRTVRVI
uniref:RNA-binding S4 domain-containing protein n=1 Tax=Candidatus Electronema sp. TaxID=2698783 RepID=UPI0040568113